MRRGGLGYVLAWVTSVSSWVAWVINRLIRLELHLETIGVFTHVALVLTHALQRCVCLSVLGRAGWLRRSAAGLCQQWGGTGAALLNMSQQHSWHSPVFRQGRQRSDVASTRFRCDLHARRSALQRASRLTAGTLHRIPILRSKAAARLFLLRISALEAQSHQRTAYFRCGAA